MNRRSIRRFKQEEIPKEVLQNVLEIAKFAPSACNYRPVEFTVVNLLKHPEIEQKIVSQHAEIFGAPYSSKNGEHFFRSAPYAIVAHADPAKSQNYPAIEDAAIYLNTVELYAQEQGFGTFWCGLYHIVLQREEYKAMIGIPQTHKVHAVICIGTPDIKYERPAAREPVHIDWVE